MITAEVLYERLKQLDSNTLELLAKIMDLIVSRPTAKPQFEEMRRYFPLGKIEAPDQKPPYVTRTVSLEEMDAAIDYEAGLRK